MESPTLIVAQAFPSACRAADVTAVGEVRHDLYAEQCAALALYRQTVARYLADVDAVEGDPCFWTAMGGIEFQRGNT
jgi:hypothetical protein